MEMKEQRKYTPRFSRQPRGFLVAVLCDVIYNAKNNKKKRKVEKDKEKETNRKNNQMDTE